MGKFTPPEGSRINSFGYEGNLFTVHRSDWGDQRPAVTISIPRGAGSAGLDALLAAEDNLPQYIRSAAHTWYNNEWDIPVHQYLEKLFGDG